MLSQAQRSQLNSARTVGGEPAVRLEDEELLLLLGIVFNDLNLSLPNELDWSLALGFINESYYEVPIKALREAKLWNNTLLASILENAIYEATKLEPDVFTYFIALSNLHAQRRKYLAILESQPLPDLETIIPRGLLEIGGLPPDALASWLIWRKFIYDIDNRSAQTAGYLFEPILALALGGVSYGARNSPIKRGGNGKGRQVDCLVYRDAYEFKMRVTIAASGQGRFGEELSYAEDCQASGYRPVLLILDPTPSSKQEDLSAKYRKFGGEAYSGNEAWIHLEEKSGIIMSQFIERYVRTPISVIDRASNELLSLNLHRTNHNNVVARIGDYDFRLR